jgi:simple sugar transport system permease protein
MTNFEFSVDLAAAILRIGTPLLLAALGELLLERAGVLNIGLEGVMLGGAFFGFWAGWASGSPLVGALAAMAVGAASMLLLAALVLRVRADQIVAGMALNLIAFGVANTAFSIVKHQVAQAGGATEFRAPKFGALLQSLAQVPVLGPVLFAQSLLTWLAMLLIPAVWFYLQRSERGMELRAVGENPEAAASSGVNVYACRLKACLMAGLLGGLAGACLTLEFADTYAERCTAGRGFIALAAVVLGRYTTLGTAGACLFFGATFAVQDRAQAAGWRLAPELLQMLPYAATVLVLAFSLRRNTGAPAALGKPYAR